MKEPLMEKARRAWFYVRKYWKAAFGGLSVLLVLIYTVLTNKSRQQRIDLERKARDAESEKVQAVGEARALRREAMKAGLKANKHQENAAKVIQRLRAKEGKRVGMAEARALADRINSRGQE